MADPKQQNKEPLSHKVGEKIERAGEKVSEKAPKTGRKISELGGKIEHMSDKKNKRA